MPIISPQYVIQAPIEAIRSFIDAKTKTDIVVQVSPDLKEFKKLMSFLNHIIGEMKSEIMKLQQSDAINILSQLKEELNSIPVLDRAVRNLIPIHTKEKEVMDLVRSLWFSLLNLIDDIKLIANREETPEDSHDYNLFLSDIVAESVQDKENKRFVGRKKLFALFD